MDSISVGSSQAVGSGSGIIDTGTTLLVGDSSAVKSVIGAIKGAKAAPQDVYGSGLYMGKDHSGTPLVHLAEDCNSCLQLHSQTKHLLRWKVLGHLSGDFQPWQDRRR
jgi:hypothetical protein